MEIPKIKHNKYLGMISAVLGIIILLTAPDTITLAGGLFLLITGAILWWMNK